MRPDAINWLRQSLKIETDECIIWPFALYKTGYPQLYFKGKMRRAHRVVLYLTSNFSLNSRLDAMHSCDVRACVNKRHIKPGTRTENMQDASKKGRTRNQYIASYRNHAQAKEIVD